jgi:hypothetical protein
VGTSKNVGSPDSPPWKFSLAVLGRLDVPADRQNQEIWRSAEADRGPRLADEFSHPVLAAACELASTAKDVRKTLVAYESHLSDTHKSGFAVEIARRALARAVSSQQGSQGFACELFAGATSYYASRDLPSFVGSKGRVETISAAAELKFQLKETTRTIVQYVGPPIVNPEGWGSYVRKVLAGLRGSR